MKKLFNIVLNKNLNKILFGLMIITSIISMSLSNDLATKGVALSKTEDQVFALETENQYLYSKYNQSVALETISAKAEEKGLIRASVDFYTAPSFASR